MSCTPLLHLHKPVRLTIFEHESWPEANHEEQSVITLPKSPLSHLQCKAFHLNGVQTRFKCKLDVKRCKRFVFPPSSLLPRSNALKTKAIRYFQTDWTLTRIVSPPLVDKEKRTSPCKCKTAFTRGLKVLYWKSFLQKKIMQAHYRSRKLQLKQR